MIVQSKTTYIRNCSGTTYVYTWLWIQNPDTGRKIGQTYKPRSNLLLQDPIGKTCPQTRHRNREIKRNSSTLNTKNPKEKQLGTSLVWSPILLQRETSYGLGCTTKDNFDTRNQYFSICKRNQTSNAKGYRIVPCFGWLN